MMPYGLGQILPSQCRPMSSQAKARSAEVCKENLKGSIPHPRKRSGLLSVFSFDIVDLRSDLDILSLSQGR